MLEYARAGELLVLRVYITGDIYKQEKQEQCRTENIVEQGRTRGTMRNDGLKREE